MRAAIGNGLLLTMACLGAGADQRTPAPPQDGREILKGRAVSSVRSVAKPEQSYALYVPFGYTPERKWPIVYVFDPGAQGMRPLELMKDAAERHGYLVVASNNSRNGPWQVSQEAAAEIWDDTHRWLAIDDRRVYFAGFSGGARVAAALAQSCRCARGVFLVGAGFDYRAAPSRDVVFSVLAMTGRTDFNYGELVELDEQLERLGFRHALRRFDGDHAWAPAAEWDPALAWSALLETRDGLRSKDAAFVKGALEQAIAQGRSWEQAGEGAFALAEYRSAAAALTGLVDTAALAARIAALEKEASVRSAVERERTEIARQRALEAEILAPMTALRDAGAERIALQAEAALRIRRLHAEIEAEKLPERRRVLQRAVGSVYVSAMQTGSSLRDAGAALLAVSYFGLAALARPDVAGPHLALAGCHGARGDRKAALRELKRAVDTGLSAGRLAAVVEGDATLAPLIQTEDYRKLLAGAPAEGAAR